MTNKSKKNSFGYYVMILITFLAAIALLLAYIFSYIPPKTMGKFAGFSLFTPIIIVINLLILIYWLLRMKRYFWLTFFVLAIGYNNLLRFYKIDGKKVIKSEDVKLMSYNVRMFNKYEWSKQDSIPEKISEFITLKSPEILCIQEFVLLKNVSIEYPYKYEKLSKGRSSLGHAIYSKYPIVNKGSFEFENTANNALYADIKINEDTVRVYNLHLQSINLNPKKYYFGEKDAEQLSMKISKVFHLQQAQVEEIIEHQLLSPYPVIIMGDFNNTAFSWAYRELHKGKKDAFVSAGAGFGATYEYFLPMRIDFILVDKSFKSNNFKTYKIPYSDHYPSMARIVKR